MEKKLRINCDDLLGTITKTVRALMTVYNIHGVNGKINACILRDKRCKELK